MLRLQRTRKPTLLRWVVILATVLMLASLVLVGLGLLLPAIYVAVVSVFLLVADLVSRS
jgi:hypothetical protein